MLQTTVLLLCALARDNKPTVPIESKILLTLDEARSLTGLSTQILRDAIKQGNLNAKLIGKSWRIKRNDLDKFVENLF